MKKRLSSLPSIGPILVILTVLALLAVLIYSNTFNSPYVLDDEINILNNKHLQVTSLTPDILSQMLKSPNKLRLLVNFSFAVNYYLHGYDVTGFHVVNLAIHILTGLMVFFLARQTLRLCKLDSEPASFFAAALWLVNPVNTQSVTYIVQRMNSMAALFLMLSLVCYIQARSLQNYGTRRKTAVIWFAGCGLSGLLGLVSKETAAVLPLVIFLYEWFFFQNMDRGWLKRQAGLICILSILLIIIASIYMSMQPQKIEKLLSPYEPLDSFTPLQRLLTETGVVIYYVTLIFFPQPNRLNLDYDFPLFCTLGDLTTVVPATAALLMITIAALYKARKHRLLSFALAWFLITLTIESSVIGLGLIYEHRTYLPSIFPIIGATVLAFRYIRPKAAAILLLSAAICLGGWWTYQRNMVWNSAVSLWQDNVAKSPNKPRVHCNLGFSLLLQKKIPESIPPLLQALKFVPLYEEANYNIAGAYLATGNIEKARYHCQMVLDHYPNFFKAINTMGLIHLEQGEPAQAAACFKRALEIYPDCFMANMNLGKVYLDQNDFQQAAIYFLKAVELDINNAEAHYLLARALVQSDDLTGAMVHFQKTLQGSTDYPQVHNDLANIYLMQGKTDQAIRHYQLALELTPAYAAAIHNLAKAYNLKGETEKAISVLKTAIKRTPQIVDLHLQLSDLLMKSGRFEEAAEQIEAINNLITPNNPSLLYNQACLYAKSNKPEKALDCLKKAVAAGYNNWHHMKTDQDLETIRGTDIYNQLIK